MRQPKVEIQFFARVFIFAVLFGFNSQVVMAKEESVVGNGANFCTRTTNAAIKACSFEGADKFWIAQGKCNNLSTQFERKKCLEEAGDAQSMKEMECKAQFEARLGVCKAVGEAPYDPKIIPSMFVDPAEIGKSVKPNKCFPLIPGRSLIYKGGTETITVTVTTDTKEIEGVTCAVVRDVVETEGEVKEDTTDWFAQDTQGNVWYFGEIVQNLEDGELVNLAGSWKAGVNGAKIGIAMKANPLVKGVYRQKLLLGEAEDVAKVLSVTASAQAAAASCSADCMLTKDYTPISPDKIEYKYYAPGIGFVLEVDPATGQRGVELVEIKN